jgi:hypothetical protein
MGEAAAPATPGSYRSWCYSRPVRKEDVIAFARRDWQAIAELKQRRWTQQKAQMTPAEALAVGDELRHHALTLHPDWPTEADRRKDLASHVRVSEMLSRAKPPNGR